MKGPDKCPACGDEYIYRHGDNERGFRCSNCNHSWIDPTAETYNEKRIGVNRPMPRYVVWFKQSGGCDYTIGCGEKLVALPSEIATMDEAVRYVTEDDEEDGGKKGQLCYYTLENIDECVIYETTAAHPIDLLQLKYDLEQRRIEENSKQAEEARRRQYESLKKEFGE